MSTTLKFFTIKGYETVPIFLKRVEYEVGSLGYSIISISDLMGKGVRVIHLASDISIKTQIKLEVYDSDVEEVKATFSKIVIRAKKRDFIGHEDGGLRNLY